jgi:hypothetical protein
MPNKIDSNVTGLAIAEEVFGTPKTLPGTPDWYEQEPNSYNDFGSEITTVARNAINASRQRQRGTVTDLDASGGYNTDITQNNSTRLLQGFLFSDGHEKFGTSTLNSAAIAITTVDGTNDEYDAASGLDDLEVGDLVFASGFGNASNNGLKSVASASATALGVDQDLASEGSPPAAASLEHVGFEFATADATLTVSSGVLTLGATAKDLTELGLQVGEWLFIGGDAAANQFSATGYARVKSVTANTITFDKVSGTFSTDAGTGKDIHIFFGTFIRNEKTTSLIKTRTYQLERQMGNDGSGTQAEYVRGGVANELTINVPTADKLNADMAFVGMDSETRDGTAGLKSGNRISAGGEAAFNTSSNVYRQKMNIIDAATLVPTPLFAYVSEASITINNNASGAKAVGVLGAFDVTVGTFEVGGAVTAYFSDVAAINAVKNNAEVTYDVIMAKGNAGIVYDIPSMSLGNGRANVEQDQPITIPLDMLANEGAEGYTLGVTVMPYLPTVAMPT